MKNLPDSTEPLVLRTDFSNPSAWDSICDGIREPSDEGFEANVKFVDDRAFDGLTKQELLEAIPQDYPHPFFIVLDRAATSSKDHPLLVIELYKRSGREFRAVPSQIQAISNNLSIANMDFKDFADAVDSTGVFRGFPSK